ncbi:MAG: Tetratricopeptide repeat protein [Syntrophorhabdaceae bacterium PtaU1.Bin034]|jgi:tetratricopeptide (TPR) repeat protein|nr:MAG: Tetratricopeptide repeat protein [Syntrophorhabdaceae bacterium PtaU1.Bin034]
MKKEFFVLSLAAVLVCGAFYGCQQQPQAPAPAPAPPPQAAPAPAPTAAQPPAAAPAAGEPSQDVKAHLKQGMSYVSVAKSSGSPAAFNENIGNAINEFSNAINKDAGYAEAYSNRAVAYMLQKKYNKALDDLKKAKELKPESASIRYNLASVHSLMGDVDYGLDELDEALAKGFNDYDSLRRDPDINNLRKHKEYQKILEKYKVFIVK